MVSLIHALEASKFNLLLFCEKEGPDKCEVGGPEGKPVVFYRPAHVPRPCTHPPVFCEEGYVVTKLAGRPKGAAAKREVVAQLYSLEARTFLRGGAGFGGLGV